MKSRHLSLVTRFPRSAAEAFKDASYATAIEPPPRRPGVGRWIVASAFAVLFLYLISARAG